MVTKSPKDHTKLSQWHFVGHREKVCRDLQFGAKIA